MAELIRELKDINFQIHEIERLDLYERPEAKLAWLEKRRDEIKSQLKEMKI